MSASIEPIPLPARLRALRIGADDALQVRRTVHLAAAKIEDLEDQVARLADALRQADAASGPRRQTRRSRVAEPSKYISPAKRTDGEREALRVRVEPPRSSVTPARRPAHYARRISPLRGRSRKGVGCVPGPRHCPRSVCG